MKKYFYEIMTDARHNVLDQAIGFILWLLSLVYAPIVRITRTLYQQHIFSVYHADKPVISIGNITVGGVGKTPLVICLAHIVKHKGLKPVVLTRGYGSKDGVNDEVRMFQEILPDVPVMVGANRKLSIEKALKAGPVDMFIADDAFSYWPLKRDLDILAIDATNPFGNGHMLPRGILREEISALKRADFFVLTKTEQVKDTQELYQKIRQIKPGAVILESQHVPVNFQNVFTDRSQALYELRDKRVVVFCAIGEPLSFERSLKLLGIEVVKCFNFTDHHNYSEQDIKQVTDFAVAQNINILMTTHKDAVKITSSKNLFKELTVLKLNIDLKITQGEPELVDRILSLQRS